MTQERAGVGLRCKLANKKHFGVSFARILLQKKKKSHQRLGAAYSLSDYSAHCAALNDISDGVAKLALA